MKKGTIGLLLIMLCVGIGCSKTGPVGPAGQNGINGTSGKKGADGVNGIDGKDGTTILSGKGQPNSSVGKIGDFYLDLSASRLYGPKTTSGWGSGFNLKGVDGVDGKDGANGKDGVDGRDGTNGEDGVKGKDGTNGKDGVNGKDGTQILNGYGYPLAEMGQIGDFYIDLNDFTLYGPKVSETDWGMTGIMLRGTNGADGKDGVDGKDANVRTYIISNPWNYYYTDVPTMGLFRFTLQGNFDISAYEADYGMVLVYMECAWGDNSTSWLMVGTNLGSFTSNFISASEVIENYGLVNGVYLTTTNKINGSAGWSDEANAQSVTRISRVKIVVVSPSTLYIMHKKGVDIENAQAVAARLNLE